jgi:hypothetical protein
MSELWMEMAIIWAFAEVIGFFRKKEFLQRMKTGAKWSVAFASLITYNDMGPDKDSLAYLVGAVLLYAAVAFPIYFYRVKAFNFIKKRFEASVENISESKKNIGKIISFQFANGLTQIIAIIAGYYTGTLIIVLVFYFAF